MASDHNNIYIKLTQNSCNKILLLKAEYQRKTQYQAHSSHCIIRWPHLIVSIIYFSITFSLNFQKC